MRGVLKLTLGTALVALFGMHGAAADQTMIQVVESEKFDAYLADSKGRALYLFTADTPAKDGEEAHVACTGQCLDAWPPLYADGAPQGDTEVDQAMLGTVEHQGEEIVTYNGWPLYYFVQDQGAGQPSGQDVESFGGEWYLVTPEGEKVASE